MDSVHGFHNRAENCNIRCVSQDLWDLTHRFLWEGNDTWSSMISKIDKHMVIWTTERGGGGERGRKQNDKVSINIYSFVCQKCRLHIFKTLLYY